MNLPRLRRATRADRARIDQVRNGVADNPLDDPSQVTEEEVLWYMDYGVFLVSEDDEGVQGFVCANPQTGYIWALFVIDEAQGRGHGKALLDEATKRLRDAGHRQAYLHTGLDLKARGFYRRQGWQEMGVDMRGDLVLRLWL